MKILYCVAGVGFGNTARALAILPHLRGHEVQVVGPPRVVARLSSLCPVVALEAFEYPASDRLEGFELLLKLPRFLSLYRRNSVLYERLLDSFRPDLVVADSDVYVLRPARKRGIPIAAINQSPAVAGFYSEEKIPPGHRLSYYGLERMDLWTVLRACARVVVPSFADAPVVGNGKIKRVPLVSRFSSPLPPPPRQGRTIVLLGGSAIVPSLDPSSLGADVEVAGAAPPSSWPVRYLGFVEDLPRLLSDAAAVIALGGLSTLGDLAALRRPAVVVPIPGHAEQWANACLFEQTGYGVRGTAATLRRDLARYRENYGSFLEAMSAHSLTGAKEAAAALLEAAA
ncbi:MAG: glycosyltransferase family protein [Bdellovibrionota bacterium]